MNFGQMTILRGSFFFVKLASPVHFEYNMSRSCKIHEEANSFHISFVFYILIFILLFFYSYNFSNVRYVKSYTLFELKLTVLKKWIFKFSSEVLEKGEIN